MTPYMEHHVQHELARLGSWLLSVVVFVIIEHACHVKSPLQKHYLLEQDIEYGKNIVCRLSRSATV